MQKIGEGRTAEVYALADGKAVKLFRPGFEPHARAEYAVVSSLDGLGLPMPQAHGVREVNGRAGIVYDHAPGEPMLSLLWKNPMAIRRYAHLLAECHHRLHAVTAPPVLPSLLKTLRAQLSDAKDADLQTYRDEAVRRLPELAEGNALCHMDFHPGNVLVSGREDIAVIDWIRAMRGPAAADVMKTLILMVAGALPESLPGHLREAVTRLRQSMMRQYFARYLRLSGLSEEAVLGYFLPVLLGRLCEGVPGEREGLRTLLEEGLPLA